MFFSAFLRRIAANQYKSRKALPISSLSSRQVEDLGPTYQDILNRIQ